ncbi:hypothetical protein EIKCOROL_00201 [Eikenella corrodens ATCC 23834]|uniref:Uncharacterized protein n=1 Tax=Eikenella corrodens ATCC 23834 TaxID=546274 RepID=C0DS79_EIKCO|nr:hypothetical protein EIKCOROL_00201 [Eikenella corrodens ATCC 23834]
MVESIKRLANNHQLNYCLPYKRLPENACRHFQVAFIYALAAHILFGSMNALICVYS